MYTGGLLTAVKSRDPTLRHVIPSRSRGGVAAVTSLGDDVFVLRCTSLQQVEIYDAVSFTLSRFITVHGLGDSAWGLAACGHYKCLYVSDNNHSVHRVKLAGISVMKWPVASSPAGLSVNRAHNVVVACFGANKIQEYTTRGSLVRVTCIMQADVDRPWHAVQLSTGEYVVSQYGSSGVVSVLGADRQVKRSYGQSQTSDVGQMKYPTSLAVTKNDDILVADEDNNRIVSMNSSLSSVQELALPVDGGIKHPWGLCLDESRSRLYVGEYARDGRLLVFDVVKL